MADHVDQELVGGDLDAVTSAVLTASRVLVAVSARSLASTEGRITLPQFGMLLVVGQGETKLVTLAERLGVNPSTAMRMADRLSAVGLVCREANPSDRRETLLRLTGEGRRIVDEVIARRRAEITAILARMPADQRQALVTAMRAFNEAGGEDPEHGAFPLGRPDDPSHS
ncbi:MarR family winged helix-turn-helix transcriptional regulator [Streptosporangium lutulentum]|uniref:DNA-binding MarR family transcriptional regulator n=1 Tax=Streptosporangium lutulentum TaxID=1461250 RepID=A0ABT9QM52_9ACTN|nr:MarR family transcriptional regulator [Streptosporangium lutulentum]MDP9847847.1 DNA-binding MarR family transcriptional regulator [Streptosporangium lutulentum]